LTGLAVAVLVFLADFFGLIRVGSTYFWEIRCESTKGTVIDHKVVDNVDDALLAVILGLVQLIFSVFIFLFLVGVILGVNLRRIQNFEGRLSILNDLLQISVFFDSIVDFV
jgi:uncharacterized protein YqhQ